MYGKVPIPIELIVVVVGTAVLMFAAGIFVTRGKEAYTPFRYKLAWAGVVVGIPFLVLLVSLGRIK